MSNLISYLSTFEVSSKELRVDGVTSKGADTGEVSSKELRAVPLSVLYSAGDTEVSSKELRV